MSEYKSTASIASTTSTTTSTTCLHRLLNATKKQNNIVVIVENALAESILSENGTKNGTNISTKNFYSRIIQKYQTLHANNELDELEARQLIQTDVCFFF